MNTAAVIGWPSIIANGAISAATSGNLRAAWAIASARCKPFCPFLNGTARARASSSSAAKFSSATLSWPPLARLTRAEFLKLRGREFVELRAAGSEITTRFTVRYRSDVSTVNALTWGTRQYSIVETIPVPSGRPAYLQLLGYADAT